LGLSSDPPVNEMQEGELKGRIIERFNLNGNGECLISRQGLEISLKIGKDKQLRRQLTRTLNSLMREQIIKQIRTKDNGRLYTYRTNLTKYPWLEKLVSDYKCKGLQGYIFINPANRSLYAIEVKDPVKKKLPGRPPTFKGEKGAG